MAPNTKKILSLYRQLLLRAGKFDNYNFREYSRRKIRDSFRDSKSLKDEQSITAFYNEGVDNLAMLKRQTTISQMFTFDKLVVEPLKSHQ